MAATPRAPSMNFGSGGGSGGGGDLTEASVASFLLSRKYHLAALELHQVRVPATKSTGRSAMKPRLPG